MSILTGSEIRKLVEEKKIVIEPFNLNQLNPNSYNVRLHNTLKVYKNNVLDIKSINETEDLVIPEEGLLLEPGRLYLGRTVEYTETCVSDDKTDINYIDSMEFIKGKLEFNHINQSIDIVPVMVKKGYVIAIDGRSSLARLGISCHIAAGYGDIGFKGTLTCEISCVQPVRIYPNVQIGQLYYTTTIGDIDIVYNGKYQGQIDATESKFFIDANK